MFNNDSRRLGMYTVFIVACFCALAIVIYWDNIQLIRIVSSIKSEQDPDSSFRESYHVGLTYLQQEELLAIINSHGDHALVEKIKDLKDGDALDRSTAAAIASFLARRHPSQEIVKVMDDYLESSDWSRVLVGIEMLIKIAEQKPDLLGSKEKRAAREKKIVDGMENLQTYQQIVKEVFDTAISVNRTSGVVR